MQEWGVIRICVGGLHGARSEGEVIILLGSPKLHYFSPYPRILTVLNS